MRNDTIEYGLIDEQEYKCEFDKRVMSGLICSGGLIVLMSGAYHEGLFLLSTLPLVWYEKIKDYFKAIPTRQSPLRDRVLKLSKKMTRLPRADLSEYEYNCNNTDYLDEVLYGTGYFASYLSLLKKNRNVRLVIKNKECDIYDCDNDDYHHIYVHVSDAVWNGYPSTNTMIIAVVGQDSEPQTV